MEERVIETKEEADKAFFDYSYVAFLDILGFKSLVDNNTHEELVAIYKNLVVGQVSKYLILQDVLEKSRKNEIKELFSSNKVRVVNISDSIIIWTQDSKEESLKNLLKAVKTLLASSINLGIPLRGSIVKEKLGVIENNNTLSLIGKGLVKAYKNEQIQNWSGCTVERSIFSYLNSIRKEILQQDVIEMESWKWLVIEYPVPIERDKTNNEFVINWVTAFHELSREEIKNAFYKFRKMENAKEAVISKTKVKIENTSEFVKYCSRNYKY
jgi:hypothetical protein